MEARDQMMPTAPMPSQESASMMGREPEPVEPPVPESGEIRNVSIRPADGGYVVSVDYMTENSAMPGPIPKDKVFPDAASLFAFLQKTLA